MVSVAGALGLGAGAGPHAASAVTRAATIVTALIEPCRSSGSNGRQVAQQRDRGREGGREGDREVGRLRLRIGQPAAEDHVLELERLRLRMIRREAARDALKDMPVAAQTAERGLEGLRLDDRPELLRLVDDAPAEPVQPRLLGVP